MARRLPLLTLLFLTTAAVSAAPGADPQPPVQPAAPAQPAEALKPLYAALARPMEFRAEAGATRDLLAKLSKDAGIAISAADMFQTEDPAPRVPLVLKGEHVTLGLVLEAIATRARALIRPDAKGDLPGIVLTPTPPRYVGPWDVPSASPYGDMASQLVSLDADHAPVASVARALLPQGAQFLATSGERVTFSLQHVPAVQALKLLALQGRVSVRAGQYGTAVLDPVPNEPLVSGLPIPWGPEWWPASPDPTTTLAPGSPSPAVFMPPAPQPGGPGGQPLRLPPSLRLTPSSVAALDANRFVVLSVSTEVANPVAVGEADRRVIVAMPMAVLTVYRVAAGRIVQESSMLHELGATDLSRLLKDFRPPEAKPRARTGTGSSSSGR